MYYPQTSISPADTSSEPIDQVVQEQSLTAELDTHSYRNAIRRLHLSFGECRPVAIVIGAGRIAADQVTNRFLASLGDETAVARIAQPCSDAKALMQAIVSAVGFDPKDLNAKDLESVFRMFLSFQKGHARRTIICLDQVQDSEWWVLQKIRDLVDLEAREKFGLMIMLTGQPSLKELLDVRPLNTPSVRSAKRITLAPYTVAETTEYIRRRVDCHPERSMEQAFHFQAISTIHELTGGVPDAIESMVNLCFELATDGGVEIITADLVERAHDFQCAASTSTAADWSAATINLKDGRAKVARLIVQVSGEQIQEMVVRHGHILIGRSKLCDIQVDDSAVSRQHALISRTSDALTVIDLSSTNGTSVDGKRVESHELVAGETISIGNCKIEFTIDNETHVKAPLASAAFGDFELVQRMAVTELS